MRNRHILLSAFALSIAWATALTVVFAGVAAAQTSGRRIRPKTQTAQVTITQYGYEPASFTLRRGVPARVTFLRKVEKTCATEVVFADYGIQRELPLNQAVTISFTPKRAGEFAFTCGMNMHRGKLIVR